MMRGLIGSDHNTFCILKTLYTILQNIIKHPNEPKY